MPSLVTGGAGLLGAALVRKLLADKKERPVVLDIAWSPDRLKDVEDKFQYIQGDLGNFSQVLSVVKEVKPSRIYHIGSMLGQAAEDNPAGAIQINVLGTFYLLEAARLFDVPQVLFASSTSIFSRDLPERMLRDHYVKSPFAFYGLTKLFNEGTGEFFRRKYGIDFRGIRYPSIVGPGLRAGGMLNYTSAMIDYSKVAGNGSAGRTCTSWIFGWPRFRMWRWSFPPCTRGHYEKREGFILRNNTMTGGCPK